MQYAEPFSTPDSPTFSKKFVFLLCNSLRSLRTDSDRAFPLTRSKLQLLQKPTIPYETNKFTDRTLFP
jgi:hypothetical protein